MPGSRWNSFVVGELARLANSMKARLHLDRPGRRYPVDELLAALDSSSVMSERLLEGKHDEQREARRPRSARMTLVHSPPDYSRMRRWP